MNALLPTGSFFGQSLRTQDAIGFHFVEAHLAPDTRVPQHAHETATLYLILDGACAEEYGQRSRYSQPNSLVYHPATHTHAGVWQHRQGLCFNMEIAPHRLAFLQEYAPIPLDAVAFSAGLPNRIAMRLYEEFRQPDAVSPLAMEGLMLELLAAVSRAAAREREPAPPHWLRVVVEMLEARFDERLTLTEIADRAGVHPSHLARTFRQHQGCSVGDYVRRRRLEYICGQLKSSDMALGEIALAAGFADQSHFTKAFKRERGMTPAEYRRRFR
jgi:AraC family transcriptional regulator